MDDLALNKLEDADEHETNRLLKKFIAQKAMTFTFPELDSQRRQRLWKALLRKLVNSHIFHCHQSCLETIRILSRDKTGLNEILTRDMIDTMLQLAGLILQEDEHTSINKTEDPRIMLEAQKCLCNLIFNSSSAQRMCCNSTCIEGIIMRLKTYRDPDVLYEVKFFDMRMLFLLTALCADMRPRLRNELHGLTYLMEVLDLILKMSGENAFETQSNRHGNRHWSGRFTEAPCLTDNEIDLSCEVLKILFNLSIHMDKKSFDEEEEAHYFRLVSILHDILICPTYSKEKREELHNHTVNLLTNMPSQCYEELLLPLNEGAVGGYDNKDVEYEGQNIEAIVVLLDFLEHRLDKYLVWKGDEKLIAQKSSGSLQEALSPILTCLCECARSTRTIRKFLRGRVLPPLRDVYNRPEQGETLRNKLCRLLTSPITEIKDLVADFLFILCKESVARLIKYTGYGNAAGLLANRGLMLGGRGKGNYSSDSEDSETEEYREAKDRINPVIGCYEEPKPDPMAGMSEEQKEYEAIQLVNLMDKLARDGIVQPMQIGEDGRPQTVGHILELQKNVQFPSSKHFDFDSDSD